MTTDRELLELAAKASGFGDHKGRVCWTESEYPYRSGLRGALWNYKGYMDTAELWNPLTDDGDALRLAVALNINIEVTSADLVLACALYGNKHETSTGDKCAAVRRAIVRAAAEVGQRMP